MENLISSSSSSNINKRGSVKKTLKKEESKWPVSPTVIYFLIFILFGSLIFSLLDQLSLFKFGINF